MFPVRTIERFFAHESAGGVLLMLSAILALLAANSGMAETYFAVLDKPLAILIDGVGLKKPLFLWINDGLMAVFFFLVGLELKREVLDGKLRNPGDILLPGAAALGGMALPAAVFLALAGADPALRSGWAIPMATDIAFAMGVLALLGPRVPAELKIFLLTLAILDDLGAILVIGLFYTVELKLNYLAMALVPVAAMAWMNLRRQRRVAPIILCGMVLWVLVLKSGIHATLAGVVVALFVPMTDRTGTSPLHAVETALTPYVMFLIVPLFAFANAGVVFEGLTLADLLAPLPLGIALGLVAGKQIGVFGTTWLMVRFGLARLPRGVGWSQVYGVACLAGIGFTMSLFIGTLSFDDTAMMNAVRLGVLTGSAVSAVLGVLALRLAPDARRHARVPAA
jgi:NhaA family Na+:H+ antiporter